MEKFKSTEKKRIILISRLTENDGEFYNTTRMVLQYSHVDKVFYGMFEKEKSSINQPGEVILKNIQYVKLDQEGYHAPKNENLLEEAKNFKFMFEMVDFNNQYLNNIQLEKAVYNFEVSDYYLKYNLTKDNLEIKKYLKNKGYSKFGWGKTINFSVDSQGENEMSFIISEKPSINLSESFSYPEDYSYKNYELLYKGVEK